MDANEAKWFRRFRWPADEVALVRGEVAADEAALEDQTLSPRQELDHLIRLGADLFPLGQELAARDYLERALVIAQSLNDVGAQAEVMLHLGTALQYLGDPVAAQRCFHRGLELAEAASDDHCLQFLLHHQGRCYAEQGHLTSSRECFERALVLRQELGEARYIESTQAALDGLDGWLPEAQ